MIELSLPGTGGRRGPGWQNYANPIHTPKGAEFDHGWRQLIAILAETIKTLYLIAQI